VHVDADPGRLNPLVAPTAWGRRITLGTVFEPLLRYIPPDKPTEAGRFAPRLARAWRMASNGLEINIELEPGVTFHDGRRLTTSDVQFTLDAIRDPRRSVEHLRYMLDDVEAVELVTDLEVRVRLRRPSGWVLRALAEIPIFPMHIYDGSLLAGGAIVGSGPWKLASNKNGTVHLTRNDKYWGGPAAIADLEFVYQSDAAVVLKDAKRGDYDIIPSLIPAHYPDQANAPGIASKFDNLELRPLRMRLFGFNARRAPLDDVRIRHALALLVNRREVARSMSKLARPVLWPIWPGGFVTGPEATVPDFDPKGAGALLDEAGWRDTDKPADGFRDRPDPKAKDGKQPNQKLLLVLVGLERPKKDPASSAPLTARELFVEAAKRVGVTIDVRTGNEAWLAKRLDEGNYDIVELTWTGMVDSDIGPRLVGKNVRRAGSPRIDRALDAMAAAWDPAERMKLAGELAGALDETWPFAGIVADAPRGLVHKRVKGLRVWDGWIDFTQLTLAR
jgi:ABC-type transport system substrate-binding protein